MCTSSSRCLTVVLGSCFVLGIGAGRSAPEPIPRDKVIHPLMQGVSQPELIPGTRREPVYPRKWRKLGPGARVILQAVIDETGSVGEITPLKTELWVETDCGGGKPAPSEAGGDFEAAATKAVKQWKYRPGNMSGVPVDVYYTLIVEFSRCAKDSGKADPPARENPPSQR